ncbi:1-pyrroline-5-carboxylate dehydrogenase [Boothiomyces macroporosus]|uniref:Multifunctional fusion protein n=1 Tax=Boothiomyces macroporosus TaxID=261099 RepID=A0AAD5Y5R7_9FUNG|nr:1-pyrroline-5-carboxylate dehydrogenase [Boothiomyces macroporosus]
MLRAIRARTRSISITPQLGTFNLPEIKNEPMKNYGPGSTERAELQKAVDLMKESITKNRPYEVPIVVSGQMIETGDISEQPVPTEHHLKLCKYHNATAQNAIAKALEAKPAWEAMPFNDRAAIFLKAADLLTHKYRYRVMAATMLGQGKNVWQAEIDAAAELADFLRFNCKFAQEIYRDQPTENSPMMWNRVEYRALEGFVVAYSPFNFTAIGGNLVAAPALMGNVVLWKPSNSSIYSNFLILEILKEAGLPDGVIQFLPGNPEVITNETFNHPDFAGFHFTGSTSVFKMLWKKIGENINIYKSYPRIVGETGGKNMHFIHESADVKHAVLQTIRGAFEYNGQKCSATSRVYVPESMLPAFTQELKAEMAKIKMGPVEDFTNFATAVIHKQSYEKIKGYLDAVKSGENESTSILAGGNCNDSVGYYVEPTALITKDPHSPTMVNELFGPVLTIFAYPNDELVETLKLAEKTSEYALTCGIFAQDREAIIEMSNHLRNAAGNMYINDKSTGAVVGQQPFGGARGSGTNDKAGSSLNLLRWVSPRTIKESFVPIEAFHYPSNLKD